MDGLSSWAPRILSVLRIMTGLLLMQHGTMKLFGFPPSEMGQPELVSLIGLAGILEFFGGLLFVVGLFTRPVAFVLSGFTAVAYFMAHASASFFPILNQGELAVLYCFVFLYFVFSGPGVWSIDELRSRSGQALPDARQGAGTGPGFSRTTG